MREWQGRGPAAAMDFRLLCSGLPLSAEGGMHGRIHGFRLACLGARNVSKVVECYAARSERTEITRDALEA